MKIALWLGVTTIWGTVWKGYSIGLIEKHCLSRRMQESPREEMKKGSMGHSDGKEHGKMLDNVRKQILP